MDFPADYNDWTISDWMNWYAITEQAVGTAQANQMFLAAWNQTENYDVISARSFDPTFRAWAKSKGLLNDLYSQGLSMLAMPVGWLNDLLSSGTSISSVLPKTSSVVSAHIPTVAENATGAVDSAAKALGNASDLSVILLPLSVIVLFVWLLKDPEKGTRAGRNLAGGVRELLPY